jgi:serine/threonine protein kinase
MVVDMIGASHKSEEYQSEGWLGTGGFATVERVRHRKSAKVYARKIIKLRPPLDLETCRQEITVMNKLSHRHVVPLISSEILLAKIELVLPLADGDLATYLAAYQGNRKNNRTPDDANNLKEWIGCLASGLAYLHGESVRHKDIKPGNILTMRDRVLYTDFGIARDFTDPRFEVTSGTPVGTPLYYAPEVSRVKKRGKSADVFSLGCVFLEMLVCLSDRSFKEFSEMRFGHDNSRVYHANIDTVLAMLDSLIMENNDMGLYPTFVQCKRMMHEIPLLRPSAQSINNILCAQARIGCKECVGKGEEEKTVVVEIPGLLGPRAGPKTGNIWTWIFGILFACSAFMLWSTGRQYDDHPAASSSIPSKSKASVI